MILSISLLMLVCPIPELCKVNPYIEAEGKYKKNGLYEFTFLPLVQYTLVEQALVFLLRRL